MLKSGQNFGKSGTSLNSSWLISKLFVVRCFSGRPYIRLWLYVKLEMFSTDTSAARGSHVLLSWHYAAAMWQIPVHCYGVKNFGKIGEGLSDRTKIYSVPIPRHLSKKFRQNSFITCGDICGDILFTRNDSRTRAHIHTQTDRMTHTLEARLIVKHFCTIFILCVIYLRVTTPLLS